MTPTADVYFTAYRKRRAIRAVIMAAVAAEVLPGVNSNSRGWSAKKKRMAESGDR
jgi:hypothetical protein